MRILLAVDGSRCSERARDLVAALPWHEDVHVRVVSVAPSWTERIGAPWTGPVVPDLERSELEILKSHRDALDLAERQIRSAHAEIDVEAILLRGRAATVIVDEAQRMEADLVVVGHRGRGRWESALLGSVAADVVDQAPCPVLVARDERLGPVVLADDGSSMARAAEGLLIRWPIFAGLSITVVAVAEDGFPYASAVAPLVYREALEGYGKSVADDRQSTAVACEAAAGRLRAAQLEAVAEVHHGDAAQEIIAGATRLGAGLIVIGTRGRTGLRRLLLGSVARKVLLHAPCSVLVVRGGASPALVDREREVVSAFG